jgi:hypothetical protein
MERKNPLLAANQENWGKSQNPGGTPKTRNSSIETFPSPNPEEAEKPTENESLTPQNEIFYPSGVVVNEILPSPEGPDETDEWFEILNQNNFEVDLSGWKIKDSAGKTADYIFPSGTKISAAKFLVLTRPTTKITLNNDGDSLNLIRPDGSIADSVSYEKAPLGHSYSKAKEEWIWSETLTPGSANISPFLTSDYEKNEASKEEPKENSKTENGEAAIVKQIQNLPGLSSFFPIPAALAVFSGIIILALKRKLKTG